MDLEANKQRPQKLFIKKKKIFWTNKQDKLLKELVAAEDKIIDWKKIAMNFKNMTHKQCYYRHRNINPKIIRGHWSKDEEQKLQELFSLHGGKWALISKKFGGKRSGKQIRHHYKNFSDLKNVKSKFTPEEDFKIRELLETYGPKWQHISTFFKGRSADNLKCRYYNTKDKSEIINNNNILTVCSTKTNSINNNDNIKSDIYQNFELLINQGKEYICNDKDSVDYFVSKMRFP